MSPPFLRMEGSTSAVTHFRKGLASGLSDRRITAYSPLSLMMVVICFRPNLSVTSV